MNAQPTSAPLDPASASDIKGPLQIADLAGREMRDEGTLRLAQSPVYVARQFEADGTTRFHIVLGEEIGRRGLMDLLYAVAPYKAHGPDRFARVIDNWQLHDRAKTNSGSDNLLQQHVASLRQHWHEFSRHRELYLSIFQDSSDRTRVRPVISWEKTAEGVRRARFDELSDDVLDQISSATSSTISAEVTARSPLDALLGLVSIAYFLPELSKGWRAWQPLVKNGKSNYIGPASVPMMALIHRRALLNSVLVRRAEALVETNPAPSPR